MFVIHELGEGKKRTVTMQFFGPKAPTGEFAKELRKVLAKYAKFRGRVQYTLTPEKKQAARRKARRKR